MNWYIFSPKSDIAIIFDGKMLFWLNNLRHYY